MAWNVQENGGKLGSKAQMTKELNTLSYLRKSWLKSTGGKHQKAKKLLNKLR